MTFRVLFAPHAQSQANAIDDWWAENRPSAPDLFHQELAAAVDLLANAPRIGSHYPHGAVPGVRRVLLRSSRYHVYYVAHGDTVLVVSIWSAHRGSGPDLDSLG